MRGRQRETSTTTTTSRGDKSEGPERHKVAPRARRQQASGPQATAYVTGLDQAPSQRGARCEMPGRTTRSCLLRVLRHRAFAVVRRRRRPPCAEKRSRQPCASGSVGARRGSVGGRPQQAQDAAEGCRGAPCKRAVQLSFCNAVAHPPSQETLAKDGAAGQTELRIFVGRAVADRVIGWAVAAR
jgi:hypothetical protein